MQTLIAQHEGYLFDQFYNTCTTIDGRSIHGGVFPLRHDNLTKFGQQIYYATLVSRAS